MQLLVLIWFILVFVTVGKGVLQFLENEKAPVLTVGATVVDLRRKTHHHHSNGHHHHTHSYHVTFRTAQGDLIEFRVKRWEYLELSLGEVGMLTHQGTRFKGFVR